jgi:hypothetical protein
MFVTVGLKKLYRFGWSTGVPIETSRDYEQVLDHMMGRDV